MYWEMVMGHIPNDLSIFWTLCLWFCFKLRMWFLKKKDLRPFRMPCSSTGRRPIHLVMTKVCSKETHNDKVYLFFTKWGCMYYITAGSRVLRPWRDFFKLNIDLSVKKATRYLAAGLDGKLTHMHVWWIRQEIKHRSNWYLSIVQ